MSPGLVLVEEQVPQITADPVALGHRLHGVDVVGQGVVEQALERVGLGDRGEGAAAVGVGEPDSIDGPEPGVHVEGDGGPGREHPLADEGTQGPGLDLHVLGVAEVPGQPAAEALTTDQRGPPGADLNGGVAHEVDAVSVAAPAQPHAHRVDERQTDQARVFEGRV